MTDEPNSNLLWSGEHWIRYLRRPGEDVNSGSVSLYKTSYSPAGEGTVAFVGADGPSGLEPMMCTDNRDLATFVAEK